MDPYSYTHWRELEYLTKTRYPNLPYHEAHSRLFHDTFIGLRKTLGQGIGLNLVRKLPEYVETIAVLCGAPYTAFISRIVGTTRDAITESRVGDTSPRPSVAVKTTSDAVCISAEVAASIRLAADNIEKHATSVDGVVRKLHNVDIDIIRNSLVDRINYYERWNQIFSAIQITQGWQAIKTLKGIKNRLDEANILTATGSRGPDGTARHVYNHVKAATETIDPAERFKHRFFVYTPGTEWYDIFHNLVQQAPLLPTFCAKSDDLDTLCQYMTAVREECGPDVMFHLLIPISYRYAIREPLHFPDCLQPLRVEGRKYKGKPLFEFNLPAAPAGLLHGVGNVLRGLSDQTAKRVAAGTTLPLVGWGVNGVCLALGIGAGVVTGLGPLIALPVWLGTAIPAMEKTDPIICEAIHGALCAEAPRILGSHRRLATAP
jgi:hypothetical protein